MFSALKSAGVHDIYLKAIEELKARGLSNTLTYDPYSGAVDVYGAMMLACGANLRLMAQGCDNPVACGVPDTSLMAFVLAAEYFDAMTNDSITDWSRSAGFGKVISRLRTLADRIEMSVTPRTAFRK